MLTRSSLSEKRNQMISVEDIPGELKDAILILIDQCLYMKIASKSDFIRIVFKHDKNKVLDALNDVQKAKLFKYCPALIIKIKSRLDKDCPIKPGRPTVMLTQSENEIRTWVLNSVKQNIFITKSQFKERCIDYLEQQNFTGNWSNQYFDQLIHRILPEFKTISASSLEPDRWGVTKDQIEQYFKSLQEINIQDINPKLIINIDETGFKTSQSKGKKKKKVLVLKTTKARCSSRRKVNLN